MGDVIAERLVLVAEFCQCDDALVTRVNLEDWLGWAIDPARGVAGTIMMQYLPFADAKALAVYDAFERGTYQLVSAGQ